MYTLSDVDKRQFNAELGARLKQARLNAGMTMQAAAAELAKREGSEGDAYASRIGNFEHGRNMPDAFTLSLLIEIYDANPAWVHCGVQSNRLAKIVEIYNKTDERGKDSIFRDACSQPIDNPGSGKRAGKA